MDDLAPAPGAITQEGEHRESGVPHLLYAQKDRDTFIVSDASGDITGQGDGLFHNDTRLISRLKLLIGPAKPSLLSAAVAEDNVFFTSNGANQALPLPGGPMSPPGILHVERKRFLWDERLFERISIVNYSRDAVFTPLAVEFDADFHDMFEVRGVKRKQRGVRAPAQLDGRSVRYRYVGLDAVERCSVITFSEPPGRLGPNRADFMFSLAPESRFELFVEAGPHDGHTPGKARFRANAARARWAMRARRRHGARTTSSGRLFNNWLAKSRADLALLVTHMETGPYPYAGIPWFSTAFGRDAIITAWQILWLDPSLAGGVLRYLAAHQAEEVSAFRDSAPGKIMHETRKGEMPAVGEVPFARYYGGVDTTPLFVALAGAYAERTGDFALIDDLWPALERAVHWMEAFGDSTGDGLIDYARGATSGLANQGWKDSEDSVFHADGRFPTGPIALVEVQGYAYAAWRAMALFAERRDDTERAALWTARARRLQEAVERRFWMEDQGFYGIAVDGAGDLCRVLSSNPGHLLFAGLVGRDRARRLTQKLLSSAFASGWGLRTLAAGEARFNPMSYHNGSVWPHDTAICAMGMARYGERTGVVKLMANLFETAANFEMRLPELFCGFPRCPGEPPVAYPVACLPQAWAAGSVFMMLQACLGLHVNATKGRVDIYDPHLPLGIDRLKISGLRVGAAATDLVFERMGDHVAVRSRPVEGLSVRVL